MSRLRQWLELWFGFDLPVSRRTYVTHGLALIGIKYAGDVAIVGALSHRLWTPLDYLLPMFQRLYETQLPTTAFAVQLLWALPFLWIGTSMTMRRAIDAGRSPWMCLLFLIPFLKIVAIVWLCLEPSRPHAPWQVALASAVTPGRLRAALRGVVASLAASSVVVVLMTKLAGTYGISLFILVPFLLGFLTACLYNRDAPRGAAETFGVAMLALVLGCFLLLAWAIEGLLCIAMALPLAAPVVLVGAIVGRALGSRRPGQPVPIAALALLPLALLEPRTQPPLRQVCTRIEVAATPEVVWRHVVSFSELNEPPRWFFRLGIAYPRRATILGSGVGAVRRCEFSTGAFVEPITAWEPPSRLAFDVAEQPRPMTEWSPYRDLAPPHLDRSFRSRRGEFRLVPLPGGRTRLEGRTWYALEITPAPYWSMWSDAILHAIHARVLEHVRDLAERDARLSLSEPPVGQVRSRAD